MFWLFSKKPTPTSTLPTVAAPAPAAPAAPAKKFSYVLWGTHCFAEYRPDCGEYSQPWSVMKYDQNWCFCLDHEADVIELMKRLDERAAAWIAKNAK